MLFFPFGFRPVDLCVKPSIRNCNAKKRNDLDIGLSNPHKHQPMQVWYIAKINKLIKSNNPKNGTKPRPTNQKNQFTKNQKKNKRTQQLDPGEQPAR